MLPKLLPISIEQLYGFRQLRTERFTRKISFSASSGVRGTSEKKKITPAEPPRPTSSYANLSRANLQDIIFPLSYPIFTVLVRCERRGFGVRVSGFFLFHPTDFSLAIIILGAVAWQEIQYHDSVPTGLLRGLAMICTEYVYGCESVPL